MIKFTERQGQYLAFIHYYTRLHGLPPAERDMQLYFRATAPSVHQMVVRLEEKGLISKIPATPRSIKITIPPDQIPELGEGTREKASSESQKWSPESYLKAYRFAAEAHNGQLVPGTDLPYIMHISFVSMEVMTCLSIESHGDGDLALQCALLHDVIEDTKITFKDIESKFGERAARGVLALSKNPEIAKELQMQDSLLRIQQQPVAVWLVKLADRTSNLAPPPSFWDKSRIGRYRQEAIEIHQTLGSASKYLSTRLATKIEEYEKYL